MDAGTLQLISEIIKRVDEQLTGILADSAAAVGVGAAAVLDSPLRASVQAAIAKVQRGLLERESEVC